jgi:hypothetical protein
MIHQPIDALFTDPRGRSSWPELAVASTSSPAFPSPWPSLMRPERSRRAGRRSVAGGRVARRCPAVLSFEKSAPPP